MSESKTTSAPVVKGAKGDVHYNWPITILLLIGLITVLFPLYLTLVIALKQPSEMTTDIWGILSLPATLDFSNFAQAMEVTDFWRSLGASILITGVTCVLAVLIHSLAGYVIGRIMHSHMGFRFSYY
jgi:raffinose/stachyose/melibiose transport system permease protein